MMPTNRFFSSSWIALLLLFSFSLAGAAANSGARGSSVSAVVRTIAYHQITTLAGPLYANNQAAPLLSDNGNRIVYSTPAGAPPDTSNHVFVINPDGTGLREVDAYPPRCGCSTALDISANGAKVISSDGTQIRIVNADGTGKKTLAFLDGNIISIALSGDGSKVFFLLDRDTAISGTNPIQTLQRGLYVMNADGTGSRQIVGPVQVAPLLGITPGEVSFFGNTSSSMDVSANGGRIVFPLLVDPQAGGQGQQLFAVNLDGTGLHDLLGREGFMLQASLNASGSKVGYHVVRLSDNRGEAGSVNFDGSGRLLVTDDLIDPVNRITSQDRVQLTADGSQLLFGSTGVLYETDGSGKFSLTSRGGFFSTETLLPLLSNDLVRATMNGAGNRFLFLGTTGNDPVAFNTRNQLAIADLNPASLGVSPVIANPAVDPPFVVRSQTAATATAKVTTSLVLNRVCNGALFNGVNARGHIENVLLDDGGFGDVTPGDKIFTCNQIFANGDAALGPHTFRFKAEARTTGGVRHATVVDIEPFEVLGTPPTPDILRLHPKEARRGSNLVNMAIEGINFFNNSTVRFLLNGTADSKISVASLSVVNAGKIVLTANIAGDAALGDRVVQISNLGGTSTATANANNTFKVTDLPDPADIDPPAFTDTNTSPTNLPPGGGEVTFTAKVSDNKSISTVTAEVTRPNGTKTNVALALQAGGPSIAGVTGTFAGKFTAPANTTTAAQVYKVAFFAKDSANNQAGPVRGESFTVGGVSVPDTDPPAISLNTVTPAEFEREGGTANFAVTVKDNIDVASALVRITKPDNTTQDVNLTRLQNASGIAGVTVRFTGSFNAPANATTSDKRYKTAFIARDGAGNETRANGETIIVHGCGTPPNITGQRLTPSSLPSSGGKVTFTANVTSCDANPTVLVQVFGSGAKEVARAVLTRTSGDTFSGSATIPANRKKKNVGLAVVISASDSVGDDGPKPVGSITVAKRRR